MTRARNPETSEVLTYSHSYSHTTAECNNAKIYILTYTQKGEPGQWIRMSSIRIHGLREYMHGGCCACSTRISTWEWSRRHGPNHCKSIEQEATRSWGQEDGLIYPHSAAFAHFEAHKGIMDSEQPALFVCLVPCEYNFSTTNDGSHALVESILYHFGNDSPP